MVDAPEAVLVIALGNPERGDDGVAWQVLEGLRRLRPQAGLPPLRLRHAHTLEPELGELVSRASGVVFVDARRDGVPGEVRCVAVTPSPGPDPLVDALTPQSLLLLAEVLCGRAPRALAVSIVGERFAPGEALSAAARRAVPRAVAAVLRQARAWAPQIPALRSDSDSSAE